MSGYIPRFPRRRVSLQEYCDVSGDSIRTLYDMLERPQKYSKRSRESRPLHLFKKTCGWRAWGPSLDEFMERQERVVAERKVS